MGNVNSANLLTKTSKYKNDQLICSFACAQGRRDSMEDNYVLGRFHENTESESQYLAVFDGHAGKECALLAADHSVQMLKQRQNQLPKDEKEWQTLMLQLDQYLRDKLPPNDQSGTTFNGLLVTQGNANEYFIQCINVGDSRSVMCTIDENNEIKKVEDLSTDHKPNTPLENLRIVNAGGFVTGNRVNGNLALSRALGDFGFKNNSGLQPLEQLVTCQPDVVQKTFVATNNHTSILVVACDGLWDVMNGEYACQYVKNMLKISGNPEKRKQFFINERDQSWHNTHPQKWDLQMKSDFAETYSAKRSGVDSLESNGRTGSTDIISSTVLNFLDSLRDSVSPILNDEDFLDAAVNHIKGIPDAQKHLNTINVMLRKVLKTCSMLQLVHSDQQLDETVRLEWVNYMLVRHAIVDRRSSDNVTAGIVVIDPQRRLF